MEKRDFFGDEMFHPRHFSLSLYSSSAKISSSISPGGYCSGIKSPPGHILDSICGAEEIDSVFFPVLRQKIRVVSCLFIFLVYDNNTESSAKDR